ncbi:hypothetical protein [Curtanaerobium respiraculi]|uniref:hypothetical protein n=1 Tax=Curtanaerobium respiraculi TaxID=2949669 RepID=UPI0024B367E9|nr:hypothetical protein [Curtanaerobium respiraculi]
MTEYERQNWLVNIDNSAAAVASELGSAAAETAFARLGVTCVEEANVLDLPDIFNELYAIDADLS